MSKVNDLYANLDQTQNKAPGGLTTFTLIDNKTNIKNKPTLMFWRL